MWNDGIIIELLFVWQVYEYFMFKGTKFLFYLVVFPFFQAIRLPNEWPQIESALVSV